MTKGPHKWLGVPFFLINQLALNKRNSNKCSRWTNGQMLPAESLQPGPSIRPICCCWTRHLPLPSSAACAFLFSCFSHQHLSLHPSSPERPHLTSCLTCFNPCQTISRLLSHVSASSIILQFDTIRRPIQLILLIWSTYTRRWYCAWIQVKAALWK